MKFLRSFLFMRATTKTEFECICSLKNEFRNIDKK